METTPSFKKGDKVYVVTVSLQKEHFHGQDSWSPTSENYRSRVYAELVTLTSLGKKQGTAVTVAGNLERRIYVGEAYATKLVATAAEVEAIRASVGLEPAVKNIAHDVESSNRWLKDYAGRADCLVGFARSTRNLAALASCVALEPTIRWS